jgi:hypothetical protein
MMDSHDTIISRLSKKVQLKRVFREIKSDYFPKWDKKGNWKVIRSNHKFSHCYRDNRTIRIGQIYPGLCDLRCLLCHEITHAVTSSGHNKKWQTRYLKVAKLAEKYGDKELAEQIRNNLKMYQEAGKIYASTIYRTVENAVWEKPEAKFREVIKWTAFNYASTSTELIKRYRLLKKVFLKAKYETQIYNYICSKFVATGEKRVDINQELASK